MPSPAQPIRPRLPKNQSTPSVLDTLCDAARRQARLLSRTAANDDLFTNCQKFTLIVKTKMKIYFQKCVRQTSEMDEIVISFGHVIVLVKKEKEILSFKKIVCMKKTEMVNLFAGKFVKKNYGGTKNI